MGTGTNETYTSATKNLLREKSEKSGCQEGKAGEMFEYYSYESSPGLSKLCHQLQSFCGYVEELYDKSKDSINEVFFKKGICSVIMFDELDVMINKSEWYPKGGDKAQIVPYTIAKLISILQHPLLFEAIYI